MEKYPIPETLESKYHGSGWALGSVAGGQLVDIRYVRDVASQAVADQVQEGLSHAQFFLSLWISTQEAAPVVRELQAIGDVVVGMISCYEFVVL
jgi:hypothetical protein